MKNNFITKIIGATLAFAMMIGGAVGINAAKQAKELRADPGDESVYKEAMFGSSYNSASVTNYTSTWTATYSGFTVSLTNFNNNGNAWDYVKCGRKNNASVGTITTSAAIDEPITKVDITIDALTASKINSIKLFTSSDKSEWAEAGSYAKQAGTESVALSEPADDLYYKLEFDCASGSSNGLIQISKIEFYYIEPAGGETPTTYSVTYNNGGATSGTTPEDNTLYESGATVTALGNTGNLAKTDYVFGGWTDGENEYKAGDTFTITSNVTLTAIWNIEEGFDVLDKTFIDISGNSYTNWSNKSGKSGAIYAGNSFGSSDTIQLKSKDNISGVVSTTSGGNVKKVSVIWNDNTTAGRTLNIFAKNTAYASPSDLYNVNNQGTLVGTIVKGTSVSFEINGDYRYVGVCSDDGAMYLTELHFKWEEAQLNPRVDFSPSSLTLKTNQTDGATVTALVEDVETPTYSWVANDSNVTLVNTNSATVTIKPNINVAGSSTVTLTVGGVTPNLVKTLNVAIEIPGPGETIETAFTVVQARAHIDSVITAGETTGNDGNYYYATGIVSEIVTPYSSQYGNITYNISADGSTTGEQLQAYRGKAAGGAKFASADDVMVGDTVVVYGLLKIHSETYEFDQDNQLVSRVLGPQVNSITLTPSTVTVEPEDAGDIVDLFTSIVINQDQGSTKTVNDIEWSSDDDSVLYIDGGEYLVAGAHRTSTTIRALIGGKEYGHATINVFKANTHVINYDLPEEWRVVTDPSTLAAGDKVILTGIKDDIIYAAGTHNGNTNNIPADTEHTLTVSNGIATGVQSSMIYTLEEGSVAGSLAFKDSAGKYLYAASSSSNHLKTQDDIDGNASFILSNNGNVVAQGSNSRNQMRYNSSNNLFSCYSSGQTAIQFYKLSAGTAELDLFNLNSISEAHDDGNGTYIRLGASLSEEDWAAMDSAFGIAGYGVMLIRETTLETTGFDSIEELYNSDSENKTKLSNLGKNSETAPQDFSVAAKINIKNESDRNVAFCAAVYVKSSSGAIYFINETRGSLVGLL